MDFIKAVSESDVAFVKNALEQKTTLDGVNKLLNKTNPSNQTALTVAVRLENWEVLLTLLHFCPSDHLEKWLKQEDGNTVLLLAAKANQTELFRLLLSPYAVPIPIYTNENYSIVSKSKLTSWQRMRLLLKTDNPTKKTALMIAWEKENWEAVRYMRDFCPVEFRYRLLCVTDSDDQSIVSLERDRPNTNTQLLYSFCTKWGDGTKLWMALSLPV